MKNLELQFCMFLTVHLLHISSSPITLTAFSPIFSSGTKMRGRNFSASDKLCTNNFFVLEFPTYTNGLEVSSGFFAVASRLLC